MHFHIPVKRTIPLFAGLALLTGSGFVQSATVSAHSPSVNPPAPSRHHGYRNQGGVHAKSRKKTTTTHTTTHTTHYKPRAPRKPKAEVPA